MKFEFAPTEHEGVIEINRNEWNRQSIQDALKNWKDSTDDRAREAWGCSKKELLQMFNDALRYMRNKRPLKTAP